MDGLAATASMGMRWWTGRSLTPIWTTDGAGRDYTASLSDKAPAAQTRSGAWHRRNELPCRTDPTGRGVPDERLRPHPWPSWLLQEERPGLLPLPRPSRPQALGVGPDDQG